MEEEGAVICQPVLLRHKLVESLLVLPSGVDLGHQDELIEMNQVESGKEAHGAAEESKEDQVALVREEIEDDSPVHHEAEGVPHPDEHLVSLAKAHRPGDEALQKKPRGEEEALLDDNGELCNIHLEGAHEAQYYVHDGARKQEREPQPTVQPVAPHWVHAVMDNSTCRKQAQVDARHYGSREWGWVRHKMVSQLR